MAKLKIEYLGHACFRLENGGQRIVLDPYENGSVPGYKPLRLEAEFVYCSHDHHDHNAAKLVKLKQGGKPNFKLETLLTDHDDAGGTLRGKNTVHIFSFGSLRLAHLGDLGRELTPAEQKKLHGVDVLLIPIGGYYTIDAETAKKVVDSVAPGAVIPMHYRTETADYDVLGGLDEFFVLFTEETPDILPLTYGGYIMIEK